MYIDVTTTNQRIGDVFEFVDLDLDVEVLGAGPASALDRDEFTAHAQEWRYPDQVVRAAEAMCSRLVTAVTDRAAPFDGTYLAWWRAGSPHLGG